MEDEKYGLLRDADWPSIYKELVLYTERLIWYRYPQFRASPGSKHLALGKTCEDIAQTVITKVIGGERSWDPNRGDLLTALKYHVQSELSNLASRNSSRKEALLLDEETVFTGGAHSTDKHQSAEDIKAAQWQMIDQAAASDEDLQLLILAMQEALEKNIDPTRSNLAEILGISASDVTNLNKRLQRRVRKIADEREKAIKQ